MSLEILLRNSYLRAGFEKNEAGKLFFWIVGLKADIFDVARIVKKYLRQEHQIDFYRRISDLIKFEDVRRFRVEETEFIVVTDYLDGFTVRVDGPGGDVRLRKVGNAILKELKSRGEDFPEYSRLYRWFKTTFPLRKDFLKFSSVFVIVGLSLYLLYAFAGQGVEVSIRNRNLKSIKNIAVWTSIDKMLIPVLKENEVRRIHLKRKPFMPAVAVSFVNPEGKEVLIVGTKLAGVTEFEILTEYRILFVDRKHRVTP